MNFKRVVCVSFLLFIVSLSNYVYASTDNIKFESFGVDNGLSQQVIQSIYQDSKGFLWVGTQEGLNRYDGFRFRQYLHEPSDTDSLSDVWVRAISEDIYGNLWVGTTAGLNILDKKTDKFLRIYDKPGSAYQFVGKIVYSIWRDNSNNMWVLTDKGLNKHDNSTDTFSYIPLMDNEKTLHALSVFHDVDYGIWITTDSSTLHYLANGATRAEKIDLTLFKTDADDRAEKGPKQVTDYSISKVFIDSKRRLWVATKDQGLFISNDALRNMPEAPRDASLIHYVPEINGQVSKILEDSDGTIWFASISDGLFYLTQGEQLGHLSQSLTQPKSITSNIVYDIIQDSNGVIWVGTFNGLNKWNMAHKRFDILKVIDDKNRSLIGPNITAIDSTGDKIFIATTDGLSIFDTKTELVENIGAGAQALREDRVMSLEVVSESEVWLGYRSEGASRYNPIKRTFEHFPAQRGELGKLQSGAITSILQSKNGKLWFATYGGGLHKFDRQSETFVQYKSDDENTYSLSSNRIISITEDQTGLLWIGTFDNGVNILNPKTDSVYRLGEEGDKKPSENLRTAWIIHEDNLGNMWFGTQGEGLKYIKNEDYDRGIFTINAITRSDGLPSNVVYGILEDVKGRLWISTNRGLAKLNITTNEMVTYTEAHGMLSREFNSGAYHRAEDGKLYFGGPIGITSFFPESIKPSSFSPPIEITNVQKLNDFYSVSELQDENGIIEFTYEDYLVGFEFASLDYVSPAENKYKYKLEGFDSDWVQAIDTRRATYTNLPPGAYEFTVKATNSDGIWNELGQSISIIVQPPPWRSLWAYVFYSILVGGITVFSVVYFTNKSDSQRKYREKLEEEVSQRTIELQQANEKLLHASITDQLTGLNNRRYLLETMPDLLNGLRRRLELAADKGQLTNANGPRLFFMTFDLDGFKSINDTYGHDAGDRVIIQVGEILKELTSKFDVVTRWGGDEFLIVGERNSIDETKAVAEKIRANIADHLFDIGLSKPVRLTTSLGFSLYPFCIRAPKALSWQQVHILADKTLYKSKESGRNTWTGIVRTNTKASHEVFKTVNNDIDEAIKEGYVTLMRHEPQIFKSSSLSV